MARNFLAAFFVHQHFGDVDPRLPTKEYLKDCTDEQIESPKATPGPSTIRPARTASEEDYREKMEPVKSYVYDEDIVKTGIGQNIRLLKLLPGHLADDVQCGLTTHLLSPDIEKYEALSYVWGSPTVTKPIYVNGDSLQVTVNLHSALRHLRRVNEPRILWVDAVCIDQSDLDERAHQVSLMGDIYRSTERVIVWLGESDSWTERTFRLLKTIAEAAEDASTTTECRSPEVSRKFDLEVIQAYYIDKVLRNDWFRRSWTVQEILLAPEGLVVCGWDSISWNAFSQAIMYASQKDTMGPMARHLGPSQREFDRIYILQEASEFLTQPHEAHQQLLELLIRFRARHATNTRDKIYAFLGLVSNVEKLGIEVDYRISVGELYRTVAKELILQSRSLNLLRFLPSRSEENCNRNPDGTSLRLYDGSALPSWVPSWEKISDESVPFRDNHHQAFRTANIDTDHSSDIRVSEDQTTLSVAGYVFDEISEMTDYLPHATSELDEEEDEHLFGNRGRKFLDKARAVIDDIHKIMRPLEVLLQWEAFAGLPTRNADKDGANDTVVDTYWQTLCAGALLPGGKAETRAAFWEWYHTMDSVRGGKKNWYDDISSLDKLIKFFSHVRAIWCTLPSFEQLSNVAFYRRLAKSKTGRLALVPRATRVGDSIMLCTVSDFPLIVRKMENRETWRFVGSAYVHGANIDPSLCRSMDFN
ncbi:heterokaryon incompatibility protein-domain-containing protein [Xylaria digitata]|nr:heterokaryon incompatibility protein-domain-containing protein [Xylaria digitata]